MLNIQNQYLNKQKIRKYKEFDDFKTFKKVFPLDVFKAHYIHDFYSAAKLESLRKLLNVRKELLHIFLIKRHVLDKAVTKKYYRLFSPAKIFIRKFSVFKKRHFKRKNKKKKLKLRFKLFFRYNYDNFLFYLTIFNKQFIIKPFNFLGSLLFYKMRHFRKLYRLRPSQREPFIRFLFLFNRRKRRRIRFTRRRIRYLKYRFKKKFLMKRFRQIKVRRFKNTFKFIAYFHHLKQKKLLIDDNFKIKSVFQLPYKLLKLNFNKIYNAYYFFINFRHRKQKIKIFTNNDNTKIFKNKKIKLYDNIKLILQNRLIRNKINNKNKKKKLKELIFFNKNKKLKKIDYFYKKKNINSFNLKIKLLKSKSNFLTLDFDFDFLDRYLKNELNKYKEHIINNKTNYFPDYLILTSVLKKNLNLFKFSKNKKKIDNLIFIFKKINKLSKMFFVLKNKLNNLFLKQKTKLSRLFLKLLIINKKKKIITKFNKYKKTIFNLLSIIKQFKNNLKEVILNFYIISNKLNNISINNNKFNFLNKIYYFLKRRKLKSKLKNKRNLIFSILFFKKKNLLARPKQFIFSYTNKLNNKHLKPWRKKVYYIKRYKRQKKNYLRHINKNFYVSSFYLYKNYFNKKKLLKNNFYSHFCTKKFKFIVFNFLKTINLNFSKNIQLNKNIDFLQNKNTII